MHVNGLATPYKIFRHPLYSTVQSRDKCVRVVHARILSSYGYSSVLSPEVYKSTIPLPTLLLVVGAVSLPLKCDFL